MDNIKLVFAPSAKRMIPYPPVGVAILARSIQESVGIAAEVFDLEVELNHASHADGRSLLYRGDVHPASVLSGELSEELLEYGDLLGRMIGLRDGGGVLGISVMGYEQLASALLLARMAFARSYRVIFGGLFWTRNTAVEILRSLQPYGEATVTVGDGWETVADFLLKPDRVPVNSIQLCDGEIREGGRPGSRMPPAPDYSWVKWSLYEDLGTRVYRCSGSLRRAHLYVWDKRCNFRCAFCRVASGSDAALVPPSRAVKSLVELIKTGVRQFNLMTNELNPSRKYLLDFLDAMERNVCEPISWFTYMRADALETSDLQRVRRAGGILLRYGVESGSQRLLDFMRKDYKIDIIERTLARANQADIWNHVNLLIGFPGETLEDIDDTCAFLRRNAEVIHSVRVNPFYLPPDTAIARAPEEFGIRLTRFRKGWWEFENADGTPVNSELIAARIQQVAEVCADLAIGFAGADPFFLLDVLSRYSTRREALEFLRTEYSFLWEPAPTDTYKARLGDYKLKQDWRDTILKRGRNYSLAVCTD